MCASSVFQCIFITEMPLFKGSPCHSWEDPFAHSGWILVSHLSPRATLHHLPLLPPHLHCHGHLSVVQSGMGTLDTCGVLSWLLKFCPSTEGPQLCRCLSGSQTLGVPLCIVPESCIQAAGCFGEESLSTHPIEGLSLCKKEPWDLEEMQQDQGCLSVHRIYLVTF